MARFWGLTFISACFLVAGCTRAKSNSSHVTFQIPMQGSLAAMPTDRTACYGINITGAGPANVNSCSPSTGIIAGFAEAGQTIEASVPKGNTVAVELYLYLKPVGASAPCPTLLPVFAGDQLADTYLVGTASNIPIKDDETEVDIVANFPGLTQNIAQQLSLPTSCQPLPVAAALTISDGPTFDYGIAVIGSLNEKVFTVTYAGTMPATGLSAATLSAPFSFKGGIYPGIGGTCGATISATCTVVVTYMPTASGNLTGTLSLAFNDGKAAQTSTRDITGTGAWPATLTISGSPTYNYGTQTTGSSTDNTFTVTNTGGASATGVTSSSLSAPFSFKGGTYPGTGGTCGATISASCTVVVTYMPTASGNLVETLSLAFNDGSAAQTSTRDITGTGVLSASLIISGAPVYDYGSQVSGSSTDHTFTVTYAGGSPATAMTGSGLSGPFYFKGGVYPGIGGTCPATLSAGTCTMVVTFLPTGTGAVSQTINLGYNDGAVNQNATRPVTGTGTTPATLTISDGPAYDFGTQVPGSTNEHIFTVIYTGGAPATAMNGIGLSTPLYFKGGVYPGTGGTCAATMSAGTCTVVVSYLPIANGVTSQTLTITYNDGATTQAAIRSITGTAAPTLTSIAITSVGGIFHIPSGGSTLQFTATGTYSDLSTSDISNSVAWSLANSAVGTISSSGLLTSSATGGSTQVNANLTGVSASYKFLVTGPVTLIPLAAAPSDVVRRPGSNEVWVTSSNGHAVYVIDANTNTVTNTISLGVHYPGQIIFLPNGSKAYVVSYGGAFYGVDIIDSALKSVVVSPSLASGYGGSVAVNSNGSAVIAVWQQAGAGGMNSIDPNTNAVTSYSATTAACSTSSVFVPKSPQLYVNSQCYGPDQFWLYNYPSTTPTASFAPAVSYTASALYATPDGRWLLATNGFGGSTTSFAFPVGTTSNTGLQTVATTYSGLGFLPDNRRMILANGVSSFGVFDYSGVSVSGQIDTLGITPSGQDLAVMPNATLYLPTSGNTIQVYQYYGFTVAPSNLNYTWDNLVYTQSVTVTPNIPRSMGNPITSYTVSPSLPIGLSLNSSSGIISGTPLSIIGATTYVVTATNGSGSTTANLTITVNASDSARTWSAGPGMLNSLNGSVLALMPNGMVLIAGGTAPGSIPQSMSQIYTPGGTISASQPMNVARANSMTATVLKDGRILIAGGSNPVPLASAEIYDPGTGVFTMTGSMTSARYGHAATLLADGRVLMTGGQDGSSAPIATAEIYDPITGLFTLTSGSMSTVRTGHAATLLPDGSVLITGGCPADCSSSSLSSAEIFTPAGGTFSATSNSMSSPRMGHAALLLPNGKVLVVAGATNGYGYSGFTASADLYDPPSHTFSPTGSASTPRSGFVSALLPNGAVLIAGGSQIGCPAVSTTELYNPALATFSSASTMILGVAGASSVLLPNGAVFTAGGGSGTCSFSSTATSAVFQ